MVKNQPKNPVESHETSKPDRSRWAYEDAKTVSGQSQEFSMDVWYAKVNESFQGACWFSPEGLCLTLMNHLV
jgi:hypothetical protein